MPTMTEAGLLFNPEATIRHVPLTAGETCIVIDDVLRDPHAVARWACDQTFLPPRGYPYPGLVLEAPAAAAASMADHFSQKLRRHLGVRRLVELTARLSLVTVPPGDLEPRQWQCHRDRIAADPQRLLFAASVLYLFRAPGLGGTSFYVPRQSSDETDRMIAASQSLDAETFSARYGVAPGYMAGSNAWFERVAQVPAAWNRLVVYDGGLFHSADVDDSKLLSADPSRGRLTLNGFYTCRRNAR